MNISTITQFLLELDRLKSVNRRSYINRGERLENSAEHSWHLAMACWLFAGLVKHEINVEKLLKMALLHDLGEIDAGDTFLYDQQRGQAS
jgi:putative hydrolases of HD superfamily